MRKRSLIRSLPLALVMGILSMTPCPAQVPLPAYLALTPPGSDTPAAIARFAGAWGPSAWDGFLPHMLIVERVEASGAAHAIYAVGAASDWHIEPSWTRLAGRIDHRTLTLGGKRATGDRPKRSGANAVALCRS